MEDYKTKYLKYKTKYINLKKSMDMSGGGNDKIKIILFKADWCGHCKNFKPTWEAISKQYNNKFEFITYDADKQREKFEEYKVDAFPTIILNNGNNKMQYEGDRTFDEFNNFLQSLN